MARVRVIVFLVVCLFCRQFTADAQERTGHLDYNPFQFSNKSISKNTERTTFQSLRLPFFEDFTGYSVYPDPARWKDYEVYINNTMCAGPVERGVATFDGLNKFGIPYDSFTNVDFRYADSLTSQPINLGLNLVAPADSVYFSFFYQAEGRGYYPLTNDSLMLFFKDKYGEFIKVWGITGPDTNNVQPFTQVLIPITDSLYFDSSFQFRFVNIAAMYWADADWNVDYIRLNSGRNMFDTTISDIGFSANPSPLLNDYTSMPYRQYLAAPFDETSAAFYDSLRNNYSTAWNVTYGYSATALNNGAVLSAYTPYALVSPGYNTTPTSVSTYSTSITTPGRYDKVEYQNTFYIDSVSTADPHGNDTIVQKQVFDNYLAYDDGSAEKSYYLNLFPPAAGELAIEFHLNQPDTLQGVAIYFGRQIPFAYYKEFQMMVWSALQGVNGATADNVLYQSVDFYNPGYADTINHFWYYSFDNPVPLSAGTFFIGTLQPAESASDSLYFGLDVNRIGDNHAWYNVTGEWQPSQISGAIMIRPLLGQPVQPTLVTNIQASGAKWWVTPNPAHDNIEIQFGTASQKLPYTITNLQGQAVMQGMVSSNDNVNISALVPGMYFVQLAGFEGAPRKFVKL